METDDANGRRKCLNGSRLLAFAASTRLKTVAVKLQINDYLQYVFLWYINI